MMKRKPRAAMDTIYFMRAGYDGPVKIGCCGDLPGRLRYLQQGNHRPLIVIRQIPGCRQKECWLHKYFHEQHLRSEWFTFHPDMLTVEPETDHSSLKGRSCKVLTHLKAGLPPSGMRNTARHGQVTPQIYDPEYPNGPSEAA